jgi:hypothetical protein
LKKNNRAFLAVPGHEVLKKWADVSQRKPLKKRCGFEKV